MAHGPSAMNRTVWLSRTWLSRALAVSLVTLAFGLLNAAAVQALDYEGFSVDRWAKLREAERYQMKVAEEFYGKQQWKVALSEYEKFLNLYEKSTGASFAQLKWALCQQKLRKVNTAIKDGFQSVIDYWPESPDAINAAYLIGQAYRDMGEVKKAKIAYIKAMQDYPEHIVAAHAREDLAGMASKAGDAKEYVKYLSELTYNTKRVGDANTIARNAAVSLSQHYFAEGNFAEGLKALETDWPNNPGQLAYHADHYCGPLLTALMGNAEGKNKGLAMSNNAIGYFREKIPADLTKPESKQLARALLGYIVDMYNRTGRPDEVVKTYDQMIKTLGVSDDILGSLAGWYHSQGKNDESRATYAKFADQTAGQSNIASVFRAEKKWDQAIAIYQRLAANAKEPAGWHGEIAMVYRHAGKPNEAVQVYQMLAKTDVAKATSHIAQIAWTYYHAGMHKEAVVAFRNAGEEWTVFWHWAASYRAIGEFDKAIGIYGQAMSIYPNNAPTALLAIAQTYEQAKQVEKAKNVYTQICKKFPKSGEAATSHAHMETAYKIFVALGAKDE